MLGYNRCCLVNINTMIVSPLAGLGKLIGEEGGENTSRLSLSEAKVAAWVAKTGCEAGRGRAIWILAARGSGDWEESHSAPGDRETTFRPQTDASTDTLASSGRVRGNSIYFHANNLNES